MKNILVIFSLLFTATIAQAQPVLKECEGLDYHDGSLTQQIQKMTECIEAMTLRINQMSRDLLERG